MAGKSQYFTDAVLNLLRNTAYSQPATVYVGLLSALPANDAAAGTELAVANGYGRQSITFGAPAADSGNVRKVSNTNVITFGPATADWLKAIGFIVSDASSSGNILYWDELLGPPIVFTVDPATDTFTATAHGLTNGQRVMVRNQNGTLPSPLDTATSYYVISAATNTFQLSLTQGGGAVNVTTAGDGTNTVRLDYTKQVLNGDSAQFAAATLVAKED